MSDRSFPRRALALGACVAGALLGVSSASAGPYSAEYVFGDSLSDTGNLASLLNVENFVAHGFYFGNFPDPPSYHDSFTNGPVAVQLLAESLGLNANPSLWVTGFADPAGLFGGPSFVPGTNYAVGGATAAPGAPAAPGLPNTNLPSQVEAFSAFEGGVADPNALYVVMIGGNDVIGTTLSRAGIVDPTGTAAIANAVLAERTAILNLSQEGARDFLVVNVPDVGAIPYFALERPTFADAATEYSQIYDADLASALAGLNPTLPPGSELSEFDLYTLNINILHHAGFYGFTNTTQPCFANTPLSAVSDYRCVPDGPGANISSFIYWDHIHPTARLQALWAESFRAAVPEPSTWAMALIGFAGLGLVGQRGARERIAASSTRGGGSARLKARSHPRAFRNAANASSVACDM